MNTGLSIAEGEVIISCDADMILTTFAIEELVKRHQLLDRVMLVGFRYDVPSDDRRIERSSLREKLPSLLPCFYQDNRLTYHWDGHIYPGWPENMCRETSHFKALGHGHKVFLPDGDYWSLPRMVYGALFSMRRVEWECVGGFDERFFGWGWSDTFVGAKAITAGCKVIPVYLATGAHIAHKPRNSGHDQEGRSNRQLYHQLLHTNLQGTGSDSRSKARARIRATAVKSNRSQGKKVNPTAYERLTRELENPDFLGSYLYALGRCQEAIEVYHNRLPDASARYRVLFQIGRIQRQMRRFREAIENLEECSSGLPAWGEPLVELALAHAGAGEFNIAREKLTCAYELGANRSLIRYILRLPSKRHIRRGLKYAAQGYNTLALQDFEAALLQNPSDAAAQRARSSVLDRLG
jgi:GT2 family glycosyltransferase/Flp pilus assembly protein TadD